MTPENGISKAKPSPLRLIWAVTNHCNFSCSFCYAYSNPKEPIGLSEEQMLAISGRINASQVRHLSFIGGEPLTRPDLKNIVMSIRSDITMNLDTNGSLVEERWDLDLFRKFNQISIGFDGPAYLNEIYRRDTDKVSRAIRRLTENGIRVVTPVLLHAENYLHVQEISAFLKELGSASIRFNKFTPVPGKKNHKATLTPKQEIEAIDLITALRGSTLYSNLVSASTFFNRYQFEKTELSSYEGGSCFCGYWGAAISSRGEFVPCLQLCQKPYSDLFRKAGYSIPSALSGAGLDDIFESERLFQDVRMATVGVLPDKCGTCSFAGNCSHGCRIEAFASGNDLFADFEGCNV